MGWKMKSNQVFQNRPKVKQVVFSIKGITTNHATAYFNDVPIIRVNFQKHLALILDSKLIFFDLINEKTKKTI